MTPDQQQRLLNEVTQNPGQSTKQLADLIGVKHKAAYQTLQRHAIAGVVYFTGRDDGGPRCWWPCSPEVTQADISRSKPKPSKPKPSKPKNNPITEDDLYYHRYYSLPKEQRETMPLPEACRDIPPTEAFMPISSSYKLPDVEFKTDGNVVFLSESTK